MLVMPKMEKPPDTAARHRAAVKVATVMLAPPLRTRISTTLPGSGGGERVEWATGAVSGVTGAEPLSTVIKDLCFLRNLACRCAPVGSFALGRKGRDVLGHHR